MGKIDLGKIDLTKGDFHGRPALGRPTRYGPTTPLGRTMPPCGWRRLLPAVEWSDKGTQHG